MKKGIKTWEFWVTLIGAGLVFVKTQFWPDLPTESILAIFTWIGGSMIGQILGPPDDKPAYKKTEFWIALIMGALKAAFPNIPDEAFYSVLTYVGLRPTVKGSFGFQIGSQNSAPPGAPNA